MHWLCTAPSPSLPPLPHMIHTYISVHKLVMYLRHFRVYYSWLHNGPWSDVDVLFYYSLYFNSFISKAERNHFSNIISAGYLEKTCEVFRPKEPTTTPPPPDYRSTYIAIGISFPVLLFAAAFGILLLLLKRRQTNRECSLCKERLIPSRCPICWFGERCFWKYFGEQLMRSFLYLIF